MKQKLLKGAALLCSAMLFSQMGFSAQKGWNSSVAVVVDPVTYNSVKIGIDAYVKSMELKDASGNLIRKGILVVDKWGQPDSIRTYLHKLYQTQHLEGAVFVGDIPVPMIRDAHHLTTAFKMSPKKDWKDSSVPSDRFYDDFDLKFNYIKQDNEVKSYYYYSLRADSPQQIHCDIYSARIKPPQVPGKKKHELIDEFLTKAMQARKEEREISKVLHFAGHGYNSQSMNARIDEASALYEQFPFLKENRGADREYMDYTFDKFIKDRLMAALSDKSLDLAILHHHGSENAQLLNGSPYSSNAANWLDMTKNFFRSKIRSAKDTTASKAYYVQEYNVPQTWVEGVFDPKMVEQDSIYSASMDITIPDMHGYVSGAKVVILDACFNGSFHLEDYIAAHYIFNPGGTVAVKANSVNTLQDTWTNELMGLLGYGVSIGNWSKGQMTLESHIIGDPVYAFSPVKNAFTTVKGFDLNQDVVKEKQNIGYWKKLINSESSDIRSLAIKMLCDNNAMSSQELLEIQRSDRSCVVRLEAFCRLKERADNCLLPSIIQGMDDSYELLQRLGTMIAAKNGDPSLVPIAAKIYLDPISTSRIDFQNKYVMDVCNAEDLISELQKQRTTKVSGQCGVWPIEEVYATKMKGIRNGFASRMGDFAALKDKNATVKEKNFTISSQRNNCNVAALDGFFFLLASDDQADEAMKVSVAETLGWYRYSYKKGEIIDKCKELAAQEKSTAVKEELLKTINRLK